MLQEFATRGSGNEGPQGSIATGRELAAKVTDRVWEASALRGALEIVAHRMLGFKATKEKTRDNTIERQGAILTSLSWPLLFHLEPLSSRQESETNILKRGK